MAHPIQFQTRYGVPAEQAYRTLVDRAYLQARLDSIGGNNASLVELTADDTSARYVLRQGVGREHLPGPLQKLLSGDLMIERTETWRRTAPGRYDGTVSARVDGAPGKVSGTLRLVDAPAGGGAPPGSELVIDGTTEVKVPLVGGKIEAAIADQVVRLMARESRFASTWLAGH